MSYFAGKLGELLERRKMRASELSRISGINDGLISKWINGQQKFVSNDDLARLTTAISPDPRERAELVRAHLLDEMAGSGSELIQISIRGAHTEAQEESTPYRVAALPLKLQRAFEILARECITDADVRACVLSLANIVEPEVSSPQAAAAGKKIAAAIQKEAAKQSSLPKHGK